jgi:hypothetical protein
MLTELITPYLPIIVLQVWWILKIQTDIESMESIKKMLSAAQGEDIWMEVQHFRDHKHRQSVYTMMMQNKNLKFLGDEFFSLVTHEKSLITSGFSRLGE